MAMVRQLTEGEILNGSPQEEENQSSEPVEEFNSRPSSSNSSSESKRASPVMPALRYTREDLMKYSTTSLSTAWPSSLDSAFTNPSGRWDPERFFMGNRNDRGLPPDEPRSKRDRADDGLVSHGKRKTSDPKERIKEEKDEIVLGPQRRSFGTGCHVIPQSSLARRPGSPSDGRDSDNFRDSSRRIGSGRIMTRDRDQRDWDRDREYGYRGDRRDRFDQDDDKDLRRYPGGGGGRYNRNDRRGRGGRDRIDEMEPEWFSGGPTSQSDTIELCGFEESQQEEDSRKTKKRRSKQTSRRSSLKSEDEKPETAAPIEEKNSQRKIEVKQEESQMTLTEVQETDEINKEVKKSNTGFDLEELFKMDWIPGLMHNENPPENTAEEMGCSRFSQWFRKDSPLPDAQGSGNNSRRSSLHDELIANVLNSIVEPRVDIPSPSQSSLANFFAPISPALSHSSGYALPQTLPSATNKDILDMLQSSSDRARNRRSPKENARSVKDLEADLKRIVLGDKKPMEEKSAFDKLLQHMSDSNSPQTSSLSIGPLDKSKALQEQDLLQDMLSGGPQRGSPLQQSFQMFDDKHSIFKIPSGMPSQHYEQNQNAQNDVQASLAFNKQVQQMQQQQQHHMQQSQQQQAQNAGMQQGGFTVDMLAKLLCPTTQAPSMSPASPGLQSGPGQGVNRNDPQILNSVIQYQRQRELLSNILKQQQQQQQQQHGHNLQHSNLLQTMQQQRRCPSAKDIPIQQTLGLPTLGISPRQSPLPAEILGSALPTQGRIPSPLVFGQQPPALSHAPAPIHPAALAQAMAQNSVSPNTLQVQNPVVLQRVPSPQELAVHTQSILQNALIKRKLEEQKENFRKRQEAQRTISPVPSSKNGMSISPHKGLSPTIAFTPTSVMRKIQSEKTENKEQKTGQQQNGNKFMDIKMSEASQHFQNITSGRMSSIGISTSGDGRFGAGNNQFTNFPNPGMLSQAPRALHGQGVSQPRSIHGGMNSVPPPLLPNHGRPIVKVGMGQPVVGAGDLSRTGMPPSKGNPAHYKPILAGSHQAHNVHDIDPGFEMGKYTWQSQVARQQPNMSSLPQQLQMAATYAALNHRPPPINAHHPSLVRPSTVASSNSIPPSNMNFPQLRNSAQNPIRAQTGSMNQMNPLNQLAALQMQRGSLDSRQLQALAQAQSQRIHTIPQRIQQMLINNQNQAAAAQAQVAGFSGNRDAKHHLLPGQPNTGSRQSPVNLAKWFGNDVLKQKMPEMPPSTQQKALHVEDVERQHQSTTVRN